MISVFMKTLFFFLPSSDQRGVAVRIPHSLLGALWRRDLLRPFCIRRKTAVGWPGTDQWGEVWLHWWGRAGRRNRWHHSELRCFRRASQDIWCNHAGEWRLGCQLGEDRGVCPGRSTGRRLWIQAGWGILLNQTRTHWYMSRFIFLSVRFSLKIIYKW